jgi:hypothetical protein
VSGSGTEAVSLQLRYGSFVVRIEADADVSSHLAWLDEFLSPPFERAADVPPDRIVRLVSDAARYAAMQQRGPDSGGRDAAAFALDTGIVRLPRWCPPDVSAALTLFDPMFRAFYTIGHGRTQVEILTGPDNPSARNALMRVVRELAMARVQGAGGLVLHAAAIGCGDRVMALAGPKGAGKTTLLIHLLRRGGAGFVANDRLVVSGTGAEARGLPTIVKVRRDSLEWFPEVREHFLATAYHHRRTLAEAGRCSPLRPPTADGYWSLSPAQFCELLAARPSPGGRLVTVVFPRIVDGGGLILRAMPPDAVVSTLATARLGPPGWDAADGPWHAPEDDGHSRDPAKDGGLAATAGASAFVCELGPTAYRDPTSADALLALLEG